MKGVADGSDRLVIKGKCPSPPFILPLFKKQNPWKGYTMGCAPPMGNTGDPELPGPLLHR